MEYWSIFIPIFKDFGGSKTILLGVTNPLLHIWSYQSEHATATKNASIIQRLKIDDAKFLMKADSSEA